MAPASAGEPGPENSSTAPQCATGSCNTATVPGPTRPLMLLDAASLYFRAFYGVPESITAPDGTPVNAVRGFCDMVARLLTDRRPARLVACLDLDWRPAFRVQALPSYKAHRVWRPAAARWRPRRSACPKRCPTRSTRRYR